jgi:hypothetical protein
MSEPTITFLGVLFQPSAPGHERLEAFYALATYAQLVHWQDIEERARAKWEVAPPAFGFSASLDADEEDPEA